MVTETEQQGGDRTRSTEQRGADNVTDTERRGADNISSTETRGTQQGDRQGDRQRRKTPRVEDLVRPHENAYYESEHHRPEPTYQYGTVDTTEAGGGVHGEVLNASPVFAEARARNLVTAARALDPEDREVPRELVTLPEGNISVSGTTKTVDQAEEEVSLALTEMEEQGGITGAFGPAQQAAAEEHDDGTDEIDADDDGKPDALERDKGTGSESDPSRRTGEQGVTSDQRSTEQRTTESTSTSSSTGTQAKQSQRRTGTQKN